MESGVQDHDVITVGQVGEAVFLADPPGPGAGEHVAERFGLADSGGRVAQRVVDQPADPLEVARPAAGQQVQSCQPWR